MSAPTLARFGALTGTYFAAIGLFNPYAPLWFQSLGFSTLVIGAIASLQSWTRVVAPYAWSWGGDHSGRRVELIRLATLGAVLSSLGLLAVQAMQPMGATELVVAVALMTALLFMANSGVVPLYEAMLAHLLRTPGGGIDAQRYGRVRVWGSVGFIIAVTAFGLLLERFGIGVFPAFVAVMNVLLLVAAMRLPATHADAVHSEPAPPVLPLLKRPEVVWFFASVFFTVLAHTSLYAFFSLYLVSLGYGKGAVGALWAVSVAIEIVFFWTQGRWFPRLTPHRWLQVVAGVTTLRFAATALGGVWAPVLVLAQLTHAVTFAAHHAACIALVQRLFPGRLRGRGQALYTTLGYGVSGVVGGVGGGWLISHLGFAAVFWAAALCGVAALGCATASARAAARADG
ncbi:MFS transporter [Rhodoferax sp.]|uniref:MFS transporter n=1 Tax=Rhodoferax sp. TaxID=50421 RepID=UPI0027638250|nr:MFS transporter [Rhodoferax sp.]